MSMRIAGVTNFSMISLNDYYTVKIFGDTRYLVEFVNFCIAEIDELREKQRHIRCRMI